MSRLDVIEVSELKNMPCILVINEAGQKEEQQYYEDVIGIKGEYLFADSIQEARLKIVAGQGYMPVDVIGEQTWYDSTVSRIPPGAKWRGSTKNILCVLAQKQFRILYRGFCRNPAGVQTIIISGFTMERRKNR